MMTTPNEESELVLQVIHYIHSPALFIQCDNSEFEAEKNVNGSLKGLGCLKGLKFNQPIW